MRIPVVGFPRLTATIPSNFGIARDRPCKYLGLMLALMLVHGTNAVWGQIRYKLPPEQAKLLEEYRQGYKKIWDVYLNLELHAIETRIVGYEESPTRIDTYRVRYLAASDSQARVDRELTEVTPSEGSEVGRREIRVQNYSGAVWAHADPGSDSFVVKNAFVVPDVLANSEADSAHRLGPTLTDSPLSSAMAFALGPVSTYILGNPAPPMFSNYEVVEFRRENGFVIVTTQFVAGKRRTPCYLRLKLLYPSWVLSEYDFAPQKKAQHPEEESAHGRMTYGESINGIPILKTAEWWACPAGETKKAAVRRLTVERVIPGPVPPEEFDFQNIGIAVAIPSGRSRYRWILLLLASAAVFASAWFLYRKERRRE